MSFFNSHAFLYQRPWNVIILNVLLSSVMMVMYEPFGYRLNNVSKFLELLGFTFIAFFYSLLFFLIILRFVNKEKWTIAKNSLYLSSFLFITGISIFFYDFHIISGYSFSDYGNMYFWKRVLTDVCGTFSIGIFPLYISYLLEKNYNLKKSLDETIYVSECLLYSRNEYYDENIISLRGETKDSLEVCPDRIVYIESSGNYVNIYYNNGSVEKKTIRTSIKKIEEQLSIYGFFVRCHRAFIVNMNYVLKFGRNTLGYRISLDGCEDDVPVSRTYLSSVKEHVNSVIVPCLLCILSHFSGI